MFRLALAETERGFSRGVLLPETGCHGGGAARGKAHPGPAASLGHGGSSPPPFRPSRAFLPGLRGRSAPHRGGADHIAAVYRGRDDRSASARGGREGGRDRKRGRLTG